MKFSLQFWLRANPNLIQSKTRKRNPGSWGLGVMNYITIIIWFYLRAGLCHLPPGAGVALGEITDNGLEPLPALGHTSTRHIATPSWPTGLIHSHELWHSSHLMGKNHRAKKLRSLQKTGNLDIWEEKRFPRGASGKEPACQCRGHKRHRFDPWVRTIPWRRAWQPTLVFLHKESPWTEESVWLQSIGSYRVRHD